MFDMYSHIEALAKSRGYKNITALCAAADVPRANLSELKMGRSKDLSKPTALKLANALGVSLEEIYGEPQDPEKETLALLQRLRDADRILLEVAKDVTEERVLAVAEMLKTFKGESAND